MSKNKDSIIYQLRERLTKMLSESEASMFTERFTELGYNDNEKVLHTIYVSLDTYSAPGKQKKDRNFVEAILLKVLGEPYRSAILKRPELKEDIRLALKAGRNAAVRSDAKVREMYRVWFVSRFGRPPDGLKVISAKATAPTDPKSRGNNRIWFSDRPRKPDNGLKVIKEEGVAKGKGAK